MNINGVARGYLAKSLHSERFLIHVAYMIERQLKEWDNMYEVMILKFADYEFIVKNNEIYYHIYFSEKELETLQKKHQFALDQKLWAELQEQGLPIMKGFGNYLDFVL